MFDLLGVFPLLFVLILWGVIALALYWVIRLAVRHALQDVAGRNRSTEYLLHQPTTPPRPTPPPAD